MPVIPFLTPPKNSSESSVTLTPQNASSQENQERVPRKSRRGDFVRRPTNILFVSTIILLIRRRTARRQRNIRKNSEEIRRQADILFVGRRTYS
jgi:hypothetical protein